MLFFGGNPNHPTKKMLLGIPFRKNTIFLGGDWLWCDNFVGDIWINRFLGNQFWWDMLLDATIFGINFDPISFDAIWLDEFQKEWIICAYWCPKRGDFLIIWDNNVPNHVEEFRAQPPSWHRKRPNKMCCTFVDKHHRFKRQAVVQCQKIMLTPTKRE